MDERSLLLKFWKSEAKATRAVLSRIPESATYRPDPKSRPAREIAWQIVFEEIVLIEGLEKGTLEWADKPAPAKMADVLAAYDANHATLDKRLAALDAAKWEQSMPFLYQGKEVMKGRGAEHAWGFLFDIVHHRGQIATYLRPMGAKVPQIYGPSADEPM